MVKRYNCEFRGMLENEKGHFVKYEDYAALELKVRDVLNHLEDARGWSDPVSVDDAILLVIETLRGSR